MKQALAGVTAGLIAGWIVFTPEGKKVAKDVCVKALGTSSDSKICHALERALGESGHEQLALEHTPHDITTEDHEQHEDTRIVEDPTASHSASYSSLNGQAPIQKGNGHTHETPSRKIKELEHAVRCAERNVS